MATKILQNIYCTGQAVLKSEHHRAPLNMFANTFSQWRETAYHWEYFQTVQVSISQWIVWISFNLATMCLLEARGGLLLQEA